MSLTLKPAPLPWFAGFLTTAVVPFLDSGKPEGGLLPVGIEAAFARG